MRGHDAARRFSRIDLDPCGRGNCTAQRVGRHAQGNEQASRRE
jgi:hypothetical protein